MLPPDSRTTLLKQLVPPPGYTLDHLVATTFTLDLESALLPCLALAGSAKAESADSVETIAAIRATIGRIDIFHQNGQIAVPRERARLFSLLEDSIHGITPRTGLFHPKIWLGVYTDDTGDTVVRLIVLSRNLTKDRSWDVALSLDGWIDTAPSALNKPLVDLLRFLPSASGTPIKEQRTQRLTRLADTLRYARWEVPPGATKLAFHVFGVPDRPQPRPNFSGYKHLVVSPFLQDAGFERITWDARGPLAVVSRQESLDVLSEENAEWIDDPFVLSATAGIPSEDDESTTRLSLFTGLHAKLYVVEREKKAHLFIGSANATGAAFDRNVEILVELSGSAKTFGVDALLGNDGFGSILESTEITPGSAEEEDPQLALDSLLRSVAAVPITAHLSIGTDDDAALAISSTTPLPSLAANVTVSISLLTDPSTSIETPTGLPISVNYTGLKLSDVTAFVVITVEDAERRCSATVAKAHLIGDVPRRLDTIVTNEIDSPNAFCRLLALLLAFGALADTDPADGEAGSGQSGQLRQLEQGLFEQLLRASVARREVLDQLAGVVTSIIANGDPNDVLPDGFEPLWSAITTATEVESGANV